MVLDTEKEVYRALLIEVGVFAAVLLFSCLFLIIKWRDYQRQACESLQELERESITIIHQH